MSPITGVSVLLPLVAAAIFPFDRVLAGMVAAGQGIEAICLFLGLTREALDKSLVRLGLRTPHDRPLRRPGARGWSVLDTMRLIAWRVPGVHPETIGARLGRSAGAVRAKSRRLGIPAPERRLLHRREPASLADPVPGFAMRPAARPMAGSVSAFVPNGAGVIALRPPAPAGRQEPAVAPVKRSASQPGQRELPLFGVAARGPSPVSPLPASAPPLTPPAPSPVETRPRHPAAAKQPEPDLLPMEPPRSEDDLTWVGRVKNLARNREAVLLVSLRYFGRQGYQFAAEQLGMSKAALRTLYDRIDLPRDYDRKKFGAYYDESLARRNLERCEYELVQCQQTRRWWWRHKTDERFLRCSMEGARLRGAPRERCFEPRRICV